MQLPRRERTDRGLQNTPSGHTSDCALRIIVLTDTCAQISPGSIELRMSSSLGLVAKVDVEPPLVLIKTERMLLRGNNPYLCLNLTASSSLAGCLFCNL